MLPGWTLLEPAEPESIACKQVDEVGQMPLYWLELAIDEHPLAGDARPEVAVLASTHFGGGVFVLNA